MKLEQPDVRHETFRQFLERLRAAGHPVIAWTRPSPLSLGAEFLRWEIATATMGALLEVDPFDEPNVSEAKQATQSLLSQPRLEGGRTRPARSRWPVPTARS